MKSDRAQKYGKQIKSLLDVLCFFMSSDGGVVFNYSKIANLGSRTYCNIFAALLELPECSPNIDPQTPYLL